MHFQLAGQRCANAGHLPQSRHNQLTSNFRVCPDSHSPCAPTRPCTHACTTKRPCAFAGRITINGVPVAATTIVRDNDLIRNTAHRNEPPVLDAEIDIVHEDDDVVAVDKPASMPVHTCGRYRYNTVQSIVDRELGRSGLLPCHRLDRLTSGVLIFAKSKESAKHMQKQIQGHHLQKVYVCRVRGAFPEGVTVCAAPIKVVCHKLGVCSVDPDGALHRPVARSSVLSTMRNSTQRRPIVQLPLRPHNEVIVTGSHNLDWTRARIHTHTRTFMRAPRQPAPHRQVLRDFVRVDVHQSRWNERGAVHTAHRKDAPNSSASPAPRVSHRQ